MTSHMSLQKTQTEQEKIALLAMIGLGIGEISGSVMFGRIQDKTTVKITAASILVAFSVALFFLVFFNMFAEFKMWRAVLMTFSWGVFDSGNANFINCMCGFQFESKSLPFSCFFMVQSLSIFVFLIIESKILTTEQYYYYFGFGAVVTYLSWACFLAFFELKKAPSTDESRAHLMNSSTMISNDIDK
jgi:predicted MFS family arabinose efflux permease